MKEAEREEEEEGEEEEEESPKELEPEEEEIAIAGAGGLGFLCATGFGRKKEFAVKKSRFGARLNSEKMEDGSVVFTFYEKPVAETLCLPWWLQYV